MSRMQRAEVFRGIRAEGPTKTKPRKHNTLSGRREVTQGLGSMLNPRASFHSTGHEEKISDQGSAMLQMFRNPAEESA